MFRLNVRAQLRLGYLAVILVLLAPLVASVLYIGRMAGTFEGSSAHYNLILQAKDLAVAAQHNVRDVMTYALGATEYRQIYDRHQQLFIATLSQLEAVSAFLKPEQRALVRDLGNLRREFDTRATALFSATDRHSALGSFITQYELDEYLRSFDDITRRLEDTINKLVEGLQTILAAEINAIQRQIASAASLAVAGTITACVFAVVISRAANARIIPPIMRLATVARAVSLGDLSQRANITVHNEIGELGATFDQMTEQLGQAITTLEDGLIEATVAREHAEHAEKVKGAFLASMSHELRTPLNAIINFTRFVSDGDMGTINTQQKELLTEVIASGKHLLGLINDVLDMSKIEAGSMNLYVEENVSVTDLLHNLAALTRGLINEKPVKLVEDFPDDLPTIRADRQRLYQSLLNVASNAAKFTETGEITIHAHADSSTIEISISDNGPGISPRDLPAVFEAFKQTDAGIRIGRGTGLGMPIAKSLIEAHGGTISVKSEEGEGATFIISLPIKSASLKPAAIIVGRSI